MSALSEQAQQIAGGPVINTGELCTLLGLNVSQALLEELKFFPAATVRKGVYWHAADYSRICLALADHLQKKAADGGLKNGDST